MFNSKWKHLVLHRYNIFLGLILITAFITRFWGINFGLPDFFFYTDEGVIIDPAINILKTGDFNPHIFFYPSMYIYIQSVIIYLYYQLLGNSYSSIVDIPQSGIALVGRSITALFGTVTVYLVYKIGKEIFNRNTGLLSACVFTSIFIHVQYSHYIKNDVPATFFGMVSFLFSFYILKNGKPKFYVLAGLFAGMAVSTHYPAIFFVVPIIIAHVFFNIEEGKIRKSKLLSKKIFFGLIAVFFGFFIGTPYSVLDFSEFIFGNPMNYNYSALVSTMSDANGLPSWLWYIKYLWSSGLYYPIFMTSLGGFVLALYKPNKNNILLLSFPFVYILLFFNQSYRTDRLTIPLTPFFAIFSAVFIIYLYNALCSMLKFKNGLKILFFTIFALIIIIVPLGRVLLFDYSISQKDTRELASEWIASNNSKDDLILSIGSTIYIGQSLQNKGFSNVLNLFPLDSPEIFRFSGEVVIVSSADYQSAYNYRNVPKLKKFYENYLSLNEKGTLLKEFSNFLFESEFFSPKSLEHSSTVNAYHNPTIKIFIIPKIDTLIFEPLNKIYDANYFKKSSNVKIIYDKTLEMNVALIESLQKGGISGPHEPFPAGNYTVTYSLKVEDNRTKEEVVSLYVTSSGGEKTFTRRNLAGIDFRDANSFQNFTLPLHLPKGSRLEFVLASTGKTNLWIEKIEVTSEV